VKTNEPVELDGFVLPNIAVKIRRAGDSLEIIAGRFKLSIKELDGRTQVYPLLVIEKFIREITTVLLREEIERRENKAAAKSSLLSLGIDSDKAVDNVIKQIHEDMWGNK
jgi:hypothetical protein